MQTLKAVISKICEPNSSFYPDSRVKQTQWERNHLIFYSILGAVLVFVILFPLSSSRQLYFVNFALNFFVLVSFSILCRSYMQIFNIVTTIAVSFAGFFLLNIIDDFPYIYLGYCFSVPQFLMMFHGNAKHAGFAGGFQLIVMQTRFKSSLARLIKSSDPEEFAQYFVNGNLITFAITLVVHLYLLGLLEERTVLLQKAQKVAEDALEQQRTFIFSFSHEMRNPINSLLGNLQLAMLEGASPGAIREMVNTAKICGEILLQTINNILDTGKHETGKLEINAAPTRISDLFRRSWTMYQELFRQKKLRSCLKIEKNVFGMIKIDAFKVNQVLSNLLGNAIKFTEKGSIELTIEWIDQENVDDKCFKTEPYDETDEGASDKDINISLFNSQYKSPYMNYTKLGEDRTAMNLAEFNCPPKEEVNGVLKMTIQDTGCGMKEESLGKLFKKFSQVSDDVARRQIGTGLGLFITKEICKAMNGDVRVFSKPCVGTTFVVCIPTVAIPVSGTPRKGSGTMMETLQVREIKALVADDSPFNVKLTSNYLSQLGASVVSFAYNGEDAFIKYRMNIANGVKMDLITLDIDMPRMNGKQVCDQIRKYEQENKLKPVKIMFISGNYDKEQINEYLDKSKGLKADIFLKKPVAFEDFVAAVYKLIV